MGYGDVIRINNNCPHIFFCGLYGVIAHVEGMQCSLYLERFGLYAPFSIGWLTVIVSYDGHRWFFDTVEKFDRFYPLIGEFVTNVDSTRNI